MTGKNPKGLLVNGVLDSLTPAMPVDLEVDSRNRLLACLRIHCLDRKYIHA